MRFGLAIADSPDCKVSLGRIVIRKPDPLTAEVTPNNISCYGRNDGSISIINPVGSGVYEYSIDGNVWRNDSELPFTNLVPGEYVVLMRDFYAQQCVDTIRTVLLIEPAKLMGTAVSTPISCFEANDGKVTILSATGGTVEGDYEFRLNDLDWQVSKAFTNLTPGNYTVWIRDASVQSCVEYVNEFLITEPPKLIATVTPNRYHLLRFHRWEDHNYGWKEWTSTLCLYH